MLNCVDIYVNMESSYPEELTKLVKDGDELSITLMIAGGQGQSVFEITLTEITALLHQDSL